MPRNPHNPFDPGPTFVPSRPVTDEERALGMRIACPVHGVPVGVPCEVLPLGPYVCSMRMNEWQQRHVEEIRNRLQDDIGRSLLPFVGKEIDDDTRAQLVDAIHRVAVRHMPDEEFAPIDVTVDGSRATFTVPREWMIGLAREHGRCPLCGQVGCLTECQP